MSPVALAAMQAASWLLVISGVGGDAAHREQFVELSQRMIEAAVDKHGLPAENVRYLVERVELAPELATGRSNRDGIESTVAEIAGLAAPGDAVMVLLIGHGSAQGREARFNIPGPDLGAVELDALLTRLGQQRVALVNTTSASGGLLAPLSAEGRTLVTATRSAREQQETLFPQHFVAAYAADVADLDKDGRVSVLEAFQYASAEVARAYESAGLLRTEHAMLDDNGDGEGSAEPDPLEGDGALARALVLGRPAVAGTAGAGETPDGTGTEVRALLAEREALQADLDTLRRLRDEFEEEDYFARLEALLVRIAEIDTRLRELQESSP